MKQTRFTETKIVAILKQREAGRTTKEVCREHSISEATFYNWKSKYGGMEASDVKRLKELEEENARLYGQDLFLLTLELSNIVFDRPYDLWQPRTELSLPEQTLKEIEGKYKMGKMHIKFFVKDNHLYGVNPYGAESLLLPASKDTFFAKNINSSIRFVKNNNSKVIKMIFHERGRETEWNRTK